MPDKTYLDGVRDGKIESMEERLDNYENVIQGIGDSLRAEFAKRLDPISVALLGNGDPSKGLAFQFPKVAGAVDTNRNSISTNRWLIGLVLAAIIGITIRVAVF